LESEGESDKESNFSIENGLENGKNKKKPQQISDGKQNSSNNEKSKILSNLEFLLSQNDILPLLKKINKTKNGDLKEIINSKNSKVILFTKFYYYRNKTIRMITKMAVGHD
jgi:hypothetical protein